MAAKMLHLFLTLHLILSVSCWMEEKRFMAMPGLEVYMISIAINDSSYQDLTRGFKTKMQKDFERDNNIIDYDEEDVEEEEGQKKEYLEEGEKEYLENEKKEYLEDEKKEYLEDEKKEYLMEGDKIHMKGTGNEKKLLEDLDEEDTSTQDDWIYRPAKDVSVADNELLEDLDSEEDWTYGPAKDVSVAENELLEDLDSEEDWAYGSAKYVNVAENELLEDLDSEEDWAYGSVKYVNVAENKLLDDLDAEDDWAYGSAKDVSVVHEIVRRDEQEYALRTNCFPGEDDCLIPPPPKRSQTIDDKDGAIVDYEPDPKKENEFKINILDAMVPVVPCEIRPIHFPTQLLAKDFLTAFEPSCLRVEACSGCCAINRCLAKERKQKKYYYHRFVRESKSEVPKVIFTAFVYGDATKCEYGCGVQPNQCKKSQKFNAQKCRCECPYKLQCNPKTHHFRRSRCKCVCNNHDEPCRKPNMYRDPGTCYCTRKYYRYNKLHP